MGYAIYWQSHALGKGVVCQYVNQFPKRGRKTNEGATITTVNG